jgi:hypothetical protein
MGQVNDEEKRKKILSRLEGADFLRNANEAKSFVSYLKEIGVNFDELNISAETFTQSLEGLSAGFRRIDLKKVLEFSQEVYKLIEEIKGRKDSEGLTQEEYEALAKDGLINKEDFFYTGKNWLYLNGSMTDLAKSIQMILEKGIVLWLEERQTQLGNSNIERYLKSDKFLEMGSSQTSQVTADGEVSQAVTKE